MPLEVRSGALFEEPCCGLFGVENEALLVDGASEFAGWVSGLFAALWLEGTVIFLVLERRRVDFELSELGPDRASLPYACLLCIILKKKTRMVYHAIRQYKTPKK